MSETRKDEVVPYLEGTMPHQAAQFRASFRIAEERFSTPPEQGEVREALLAALGDADTVKPHSARLARLLGLSVATWTPPQVADALLARVPAEGVMGERKAWIDGAAWASMDNDEISVKDIEAAADEKFGPEAVPSDDMRLDWLASQTQPNHGVILCALDLPDEKWASVQRVNQFHNPHKVEWCVEGRTLREAIDKAMSDTPEPAPDDPQRARATPPAAETGEPHIKRVKVDAEFMKEMAKDSAPVTLRIETQDDGDLFFVCTRHDCSAPAPREVSEAMVEAGAVIVYAAMQSVSKEGQSKPWVEGGNSLAQGEARRACRAILRAALSAETGTE